MGGFEGAIEGPLVDCKVGCADGSDDNWMDGSEEG